MIKMLRKHMMFLLFLIFFGILLLIYFSSTENKKKRNFPCTESQFWQRKLVLDHKETFTLRWNITGNEITFMMTGKTSGWLGLGFSSNGKMDNADFVIGWVKEDTPYLQDFFIKHDVPILDFHQNYELLNGWQDYEFTNICFKRNLSTCDNEDLEIKNGTVRLLWALGDDDPKDEGNEIPNFPGENTGSRSYFLLNAAFPKPKGPDIQYMDILMPDVEIVNNSQTMYACSFVKMPKLNRSHLLGYEINFHPGHKHLLHHMLLYECDNSVSKQIEKSLQEEPHGGECNQKHALRSWSNCQTLIVWVVGSEGEFYPPEVGHVLYNPNDNQYFIMENHYHNEDITPGIIDHTGFRLYYTEKLRKNDAGLFVVGMSSILVPPQQERVLEIGFCKPECIEKNVPPTGIQLFGAVLHSHFTTVEMAFRVIRNGTEISLLDDQYWDPSYEGDIMKVHCVFNTMERNFTVLNGGGKYDEMCRVFVQFYPENSFRWCISDMPYTKALDLMGVQLWPNSTSVMIPSSASNMSIYSYLPIHKWTNDQTGRLERLFLEEPQTSTCSNLKDYTPNNNLYRIPSYEPYTEDKCNNVQR